MYVSLFCLLITLWLGNHIKADFQEQALPIENVDPNLHPSLFAHATETLDHATEATPFNESQPQEPENNITSLMKSTIKKQAVHIIAILDQLSVHIEKKNNTICNISPTFLKDWIANIKNLLLKPTTDHVSNPLIVFYQHDICVDLLHKLVTQSMITIGESLVLPSVEEIEEQAQNRITKSDNIFSLMLQIQNKCNKNIKEIGVALSTTQSNTYGQITSPSRLSAILKRVTAGIGAVVACIGAVNFFSKHELDPWQTKKNSVGLEDQWLAAKKMDDDIRHELQEIIFSCRIQGEYPAFYRQHIKNSIDKLSRRPAILGKLDKQSLFNDLFVQSVMAGDVPGMQFYVEECGVNPNLSTESAPTILHNVSINHRQVFDALERLGCKISDKLSIKDQSGNTPLHLWLRELATIRQRATKMTFADFKSHVVPRIKEQLGNQAADALDLEAAYAQWNQKLPKDSADLEEMIRTSIKNNSSAGLVKNMQHKTPTDLLREIDNPRSATTEQQRIVYTIENQPSPATR